MQKLTDNIYVLVIMAMVGMSMLAGAFVLIQILARNKIWMEKKKLLDAQILHQKELLHAIISSQEDERKRIGMDLHDSVSSTLSGLRMMIAKLVQPSSSNATATQLGHECKKIIDQVIGDVRDISHDLSPPIGSAYFLSDVLEDLCDRINRSGEISMILQLPENGSADTPDATVSLALYRVFTELVNNTIRHADATQIHIIVVVSNSEMIIEYKDNGVGMAKGAARGMGLNNIESRLSYIGAGYMINTTENNKPGIRKADMEDKLHKGFSIIIRLPV